MPGAFAVPSSEVPGYSPIYRHPNYKDGSINGEFSDITTLHELFAHTVETRPDEEFLGTREYFPKTGVFGKYQWITTTEANDIVRDFGSGLDSVYATYAPECNSVTDQQAIGIFALNRPEWMMAEFAAFRSRRYTVGISDAVGVESAEQTINTTGIRVIVCSIDKIPRMLDRKSMTPSIEVVISMDNLDCSKPSAVTQAINAETVEQLKAKASSLGVVLLDMDGVIKMGQANPTAPTPPIPSDLCTICFTSGTGGAQKGALLTHKTFIHATRGAYMTGHQKDITYLSFMSFAHIFDRYTIYTFMHDQIRVGFFSGDVTKVLDDMQVLRPNIIAGVPPFLNRIYDRIAAATIGAGGLVGFLSRMGYRSKTSRIRSGGGFKHALWDALVFNKVAKLFGGNIRMLISGATPLRPDVQNFFRVCLSCMVLQGYGQTETAAGGLIQGLDDYSDDNIGMPNPGVDVRLRGIPDMGYNVSDSPVPRGELMIRSNILFSGYLNQSQADLGMMDADGWMATGDIARINSDGSFSLIDRKNNLIKTATVLWIEPGPVEAIYSAHRLVSYVFVYGVERAYELVAIVVPDPESFVPWARIIAKDPEADLVELCKNVDVAGELTKELRKTGAIKRLPAPAMIGAVHLEPNSLNQVRKDFYTSSFKLRRYLVNQHYKPVFDNLYSHLDCVTDPTFSLSGTLSLN